MKIHHLNCGSLMGRFPRMESMVYCLLIESTDGLILVDSGIGLQDYANPSQLMKVFMYWVGVAGEVEETAAYQVERLGFARSNVRHIVLTHLHLDHAGGLRDFPDAQVHIYRDEYEAAMKRQGVSARAYDPQHWSHGPNWVVHEGTVEDWYGFNSLPIGEVRGLDIRLVPLPGHTRGHCGVAIGTEEGWLLQCGDAASPHHRDGDIHGGTPDRHTAEVLPGWLVRWMLGPHVPNLRALLRSHGDEIKAISAHDTYSFEKYQEAG